MKKVVVPISMFLMLLILTACQQKEAGPIEIQGSGKEIELNVNQEKLKEYIETVFTSYENSKALNINRGYYDFTVSKYDIGTDIHVLKRYYPDVNNHTLESYTDYTELSYMEKQYVTENEIEEALLERFRDQEPNKHQIDGKVFYTTYRGSGFVYANEADESKDDNKVEYVGTDNYIYTVYAPTRSYQELIPLLKDIENNYEKLKVDRGIAKNYKIPSHIPKQIIESPMTKEWLENLVDDYFDYLGVSYASSVEGDNQLHWLLLNFYGTQILQYNLSYLDVNAQFNEYKNVILPDGAEGVIKQEVADDYGAVHLFVQDDNTITSISVYPHMFMDLDSKENWQEDMIALLADIYTGLVVAK